MRLQLTLLHGRASCGLDVPCRAAMDPPPDLQAGAERDAKREAKSQARKVAQQREERELLGAPPEAEAAAGVR